MTWGRFLSGKEEAAPDHNDVRFIGPAGPLPHRPRSEGGNDPAGPPAATALIVNLVVTAGERIPSDLDEASPLEP
ncbi:hypothetical protein GCM10009850_108060 [Nonomuraea monospora]|uniref:Uncharacterized protein n=1 Tax=Nonomuraea monospora TaxID=568818 RepID=A0ABP5PUK8_9ACTN